MKRFAPMICVMGALGSGNMAAADSHGDATISANAQMPRPVEVLETLIRDHDMLEVEGVQMAYQPTLSRMFAAYLLPPEPQEDGTTIVGSVSASCDEEPVSEGNIWFCRASFMDSTYLPDDLGPDTQSAITFYFTLIPRDGAELCVEDDASGVSRARPCHWQVEGNVLEQLHAG